MMKKFVLAMLLASSALISAPQAALARGGDDCELNCFWTTTSGPNGEVTGGYWTCSGIYQDCVGP